VQADAEDFLQQITENIEGQLDALYESVTVEKKQELADAVTLTVTRIADRINKDVNLYLAPETVIKFE
jgi:cell fate (sporulation/competence/biofilm development) regulator YmcA (YheA/YmcA/DUF963 family)